MRFDSHIIRGKISGDKNMIKVAVVASLLKAISPESTGGTEAFASILTEGLVKAGIDVTLFATSDSKTTATLKSVCSSKQTTNVYEGNVEIRTVYQILQVSQMMQMANQFDIIHNNYFGFYLLTAFTPFIEQPIITTMHNHFWHYPNLKETLIKTHRKEKDVIVFGSHASRNLIGDEIHAEVIHHGIDISQFHFSSTPDDYILYLSRLVPAKGIKDAVLASQKGNFKLISAGGLPLFPDDKAYIDKEVMPYFSETTPYLGAVSENEKQSLYQKAKALIFPTHLDEEFGFVMAEAMSCGTPVIAYNRGAVSEVVQDGITGFIIDPDDEQRPGKGSWVIKKKGIDGLVEAVKRIGEIDRAVCHAHVKKNFTREQMVEKYMALYKRMSEK